MLKREISQSAKALRQRIERRTLVSAERPSLDKWLLRASHASQFGLFLFTIGTLYFTVLPLYQKALLEEAIAKKEVELKRVTAEMEKIYSRTRDYTIREYVFAAGGACSGLMRSVEWYIKSDRERSNRRDDRIFAIDVPACLKAMLDRQKSISDLRSEDRVLLAQRITETANRLREKREAALKEHASFPSRAKENPNLLPPTPDVRGEVIALQEDLYQALNKARIAGSELKPSESFAEQRSKLALELGLESIADRYAEAIRTEVLTLRDIKWPERPGS